MSREIGDIVRLYRSRPGEQFGLATIVRTQGSSFRLPGARMLMSQDGCTAGSISGGCLEDEVTGQIQKLFRSEKSALLRFDTRKRFGCHGKIEILIELADPLFLAQLSAAYAQRKMLRVATSDTFDVPGWRTRCLSDHEGIEQHALVQVLDPTVQLIVVGNGPDCLALHQISAALGWSVRRVDQASEIGESCDAWTAALIKTHNYGRDFAALRFLLPLALPYVGLLGPRRRREQLLGDLLDTGLGIPQNLFAPAGHDLGGDSPESIALAVIAEIHAVFAGKGGNHLRDLSTPIHPDRASSNAPNLDDVGGLARTPILSASE